jgi:hypothetical protein
MSDADDTCDDAAAAFLEDMLDEESYSEDSISDFTHKYLDGASVLYGISDSDLLDAAEEGLSEHGAIEIGRRSGLGVRDALQTLAYYAFSSRIQSRIYEIMREAEIEDGSRCLRRPPAPAPHHLSESGDMVYRSPFEVFRPVTICFGTKSLDIFVDVTSDYEEETSLELMGESIDETRGEDPSTDP